MQRGSKLYHCLKHHAYSTAIMIRGAYIEMVGYGLIRKTDYKMYENLPHSEREGGGGGEGSWRFSLLASASACDR